MIPSETEIESVRDKIEKSTAAPGGTLASNRSSLFNFGFDHVADDVRGCRSKLVLERVVEKHADEQSGEEVVSLGYQKHLRALF